MRHQNNTRIDVENLLVLLSAHRLPQAAPEEWRRPSPRAPGWLTASSSPQPRTPPPWWWGTGCWWMLTPAGPTSRQGKGAARSVLSPGVSEADGCLLMKNSQGSRLVHLDVEEWSENCWRQLSYAIKNQLGHPKPPTRGFRNVFSRFLPNEFLNFCFCN